LNQGHTGLSKFLRCVEDCMVIILRKENLGKIPIKLTNDICS